MKKVLMSLTWILLIVLISCELKKDSDTDGTVEPTDETISISAPDAGDILVVAESFEITWTSNTSTNLNVDYTTNNGRDWLPIADNIEDVGSYIWDPIPNNVSDQCRIKVYTTDSTVSDISNGFFSIVEPSTQSLRVIRPNGGEVLLANNSYTIQWISTRIENVSIEVSFDNGVTWNIITESFSADSGAYNWDPIPNYLSDQCLIRISDVSDNTVFDTNDKVFTIGVPKEIRVTVPNGGESWTGNTSQNITWYSSEIENVKIEYTLNNGVDWFVITDSTPSDGFYTWDPVPNIPSTNAKVRITNIDEGFPSDESDSVFDIEPELFITVLSPNGEEEWLTGSGHYIQWTTSTPDPTPAKAGAFAGTLNNETQKSIDKNRNGLSKSKTNSIQNTIVQTNRSSGSISEVQSLTDVMIEFSTNNGGTWITITESTPNDGNYLWNPVPAHNSVLCVVRISDAADGVPFDLSDNSFTISETPTLSIIVNSPNGGEEWNSGTSQTIIWNSQGISAVDIDYSTNNGVDWISIVGNIPSSGIYNWNQVPNTASSNCKIRVSNSLNGAPFDESNETFSILPEPGITVSAPNGGETLQTGTSTNVTWTSENIENVKLELTTNNGASWTTIISSTESDGNFTWVTIPDINSSLCKIRVSDASDGIPSDVSDEVFIITNQVEQSIELKVPNGGEQWEANTSKLLEWASNGIDSVRVQFSSNNGISWVSVNNAVPNTGSYDWTVPNLNSTQAKIKVSDALDDEPIDESNGTFTIRQSGYLKILNPETGDVWISGDLNRIEWEAQNVEKIKIEYTLTDALYDPEADFFDDEWITLTEDAPGAAGFYETRFTTPSVLYRLRISDSNLDSPVDFSGLFTVKARPVKTVTVEVPNGEEMLFAGASYNLRWSSENIEHVDISFSTNNGASWQAIVDSTESDGVYTWQAVPNISSSLCKIKINDSVDDQFFDESDASFEIVYQNQILTVSSPNGGESWDAGTTQDITWQTTGVENVKIELTTNNGIDWSVITNSTPSDGHYTWAQVSSTASTNCKIKVSDAVDGMPSDDSDEFFTIAPEPDITVLFPNGGENYLTGTSTTINWTSINVSDIKIEYTTNGGANWIVIVDSTPSDGTYLWDNIPNLNSSLCQVRISDANDGSPYDLSDDYFFITNQVEETIKVSSPNGGEIFEAGTIQNITWQATGIENVDVDFSTNNGLTWNNVASAIVSSGAVEWSIPLGINSPQCKVRVKDSDDDIPNDESDGSFVVKPAQSINVSLPSGGEVYKAGDAIIIRWSATGIESVGIKYTTTNGLGSFNEPTFYTVTQQAPNTGEFITSFSIPSDRYYVVVFDASDGSPESRSLGNFTVLAQETSGITINSPVGGENFLSGEVHEIKWNSSGVEFVNIEYTTNGGAVWLPIADAQNIASTGSYNWIVPVISPGSENCKIRISDATNEQIFGASPDFFSVHSPYVRVISPNGGEIWDYDEGQLILWESAGVSNVDIYISTNNGVSWDVVINDFPSAGAYEWDPPDIATNLGRIKIVDSNFPARSDVSDSFFQLDNIETGPRPFIIIVSPLKDDVYAAGSDVTLRWRNSRDVTQVDILYSLDNGNTWIALASLTDSPWNEENSFDWLGVPGSNEPVRLRFTGRDEFGIFVTQQDSEPFYIQ